MATNALITKYSHTLEEVKDSNIKGLVLSRFETSIYTKYDEHGDATTSVHKRGFVTTKQTLEDSNGNIDRLICIRVPFDTDVTKLPLGTHKCIFDKDGKIIKEEHTNINDVVVSSRQYFYDGDVKTKVVVKERDLIKTIEFDRYGNVTKEYSKTIASGVIARKQSNTFAYIGDPDKDPDSLPIREDHYDSGLTTTYKYHKDETGHIIESIMLTRKMYDDKRVVATLKTSYDPLHDYKICRVEKNGELVLEYRYNDKGEVNFMFLKGDEESKVTKLSSEVDPETGEKTITVIDNITYSDGTTKTKVYKKVFDVNGNLISNTKDDGSVDTYTYDENNRRLTATHKVVYNGQLILVHTVNYTYGETNKRELTYYDVDGNITKVETESVTDSNNKKCVTLEKLEYGFRNSEQE